MGTRYKIYLNIGYPGRLDDAKGALWVNRDLLAKAGNKVRLDIVHLPGYSYEKVEVYAHENHGFIGWTEVFNPGDIPSLTNTLVFDMPECDINVNISFAAIKDNDKEENTMAPSFTPDLPAVVDHFEIPDELAKELSDLLTRQTIRERLLMQNVSDRQKFDELETMLVPITARIEAMKMRITAEYVPEHYRFPNYQWNYDGYEVAGNRVNVIQLSN